MSAAANVEPRVGGGKGTEAWTGGSNIQAQQKTRPKSTNARRPLDFKSAHAIEMACIKGASANQRISKDEKTSPITLTSWISVMKKMIEYCGMVTAFSILALLRAQRCIFWKIGEVLVKHN